MLVLETPRLQLRRFTLDDAEFIFRLVNDPSWLQFIGDKNVHNLDDARRYLREGPLDMYQRHGFGMYRVEERESGTPAGMAGLINLGLVGFFAAGAYTSALLTLKLGWPIWAGIIAGAAVASAIGILVALHTQGF